MPYKDLRDFIDRLKKEGELWEIEAEVDPHLELGAICRKALNEKAPALLFKNVKGYSHPVFANMLGTRRRMALAMETSEENLLKKYVEQTSVSLAIPTPLVADGPCKEVKVAPGSFDLKQLIPQILSNPDDGGPFINYGLVICKDPDTGIRNMGIYRFQMREGKTRTGLWSRQPQHLAVILSKYGAMNKPMEIAIAIGADPLLYIASQVRELPLDTDEIALASAMKGEPIELIRCETVDLEVPAHSELVLEGKVLPGVREPEGPYGEYPGYYGPVLDFPVVEFQYATHRKDPIYNYTYLGTPPTDCHVIMSLGMEGGYLNRLKADVAPLVKDVYCPPDCHTIIVSVKKGYDEHAKHIIYTIFADRMSKTIIVVDEDINPRDMEQVFWALANRFHPSRDIVVGEGFGSIGPSHTKYNAPYTNKMGIDAAEPLQGFPKLVRASSEVMDKVEKRWDEIIPSDKCNQR